MQNVVTTPNRNPKGKRIKNNKRIGDWISVCDFRKFKERKHLIMHRIEEEWKGDGRFKYSE